MSKKVTQLTELTTPDDADQFVVVDTEAGSTKRITRGNMLANSIGSAELESDAVTAPKIAVNAVQPEDLVSGTGTTWAWQTWTPTWSKASGTPPTLGNGTLTGRYRVIGKTVTAQFDFVFGSTTNPNGGELFLFSFPVTASALSGTSQIGIGSAYVEDSGLTGWMGAICAYNTASFLVKTNASPTAGTATNISGGAPFTWGTNDLARGTFTYEAA